MISTPAASNDIQTLSYKDITVYSQYKAARLSDCMEMELQWIKEKEWNQQQQCWLGFFLLFQCVVHLFKVAYNKYEAQWLVEGRIHYI